MKLRLPILQGDGWLAPVAAVVERRYAIYSAEYQRVEQQHGDLLRYAGLSRQLGVSWDESRGGWWVREWLPAARWVSVFGDFNGWNRMQYNLQRRTGVEFGAGVWEIFLGCESGFQAGSHLKLHICGEDWSSRDRIPATIGSVARCSSGDYCGVAVPWAGQRGYDWQGDRHQTLSGAPFIYEAHVGMSGEEEAIATYRYFADSVLPRIARLGYNVVQLMGIAEHPYYASFGYHVSNFFAPSERFGGVDDFRYLVRTAHSLGLVVVLDVVHAHYISNLCEGIDAMDGSGGLYSRAGDSGAHPQWGSRVFDYSSEHVRRFLLSNLRYWMEEFHIDGFRFDGVGSMLYKDCGVGEVADDYERFFGGGVNEHAILYLTMANSLIRQVHPGALTIAEDVSGMPGLTVPVEDGGIGFDYRLGMGLPDFWVRMAEECQPEKWDIDQMWAVMNDRVRGVGTIAYVESHDQALVGDKTLIFRLLGALIYDSMHTTSASDVVAQSAALHKIVRLYTAAVGGHGWMNFMGNEFGHPEWIDFPREGNGWSYKHARRMWSLADDESLRFAQLQRFDADLVGVLRKYQVLSGDQYADLRMSDRETRVQIFWRSGVVFAVNWHADLSCYCTVLVPTPGNYRVVLSSVDSFLVECPLRSCTHYEAVALGDGRCGFEFELPPLSAFAFVPR